MVADNFLVFLSKFAPRSIARPTSNQLRAGKGSHTVWSHAKLEESITVSGHDGDDAKPYQERDVRQIIKQAERSP